jgi:hypothetical protein
VDQHYYSIASKATLLKPEAMPVPADKFEAGFGVPWAQVLKEGSALNALDACAALGVDAAGLDELWKTAKKVKLGTFPPSSRETAHPFSLGTIPPSFTSVGGTFPPHLSHLTLPSLSFLTLPPLPCLLKTKGGGFYAGKISVEGKKPVYVFNGFFMEMRSKYVNPGTSIHYYLVAFDPAALSWTDFRAKVLGPTDPAAAPEGALRGTIHKDWQALGLAAPCNVGDNGLHASASPFEALAERMNWLGVGAEGDAFGAALLRGGVSAATIAAWSKDPQVGGKSLFDQLEDLDAAPCLAKAQQLAKLA